MRNGRADVACISWRVLDLSARTLGAFRIAVGLALLAMLRAMGTIAPTTPISAQRHYAGIDLPFVHALAADPSVERWVYRLAVGSALAFTVGFLTRASYAVLVATLFLAVLISLEQSGAHNWGLPLVTMLAWLAVPWGDGLSVDQVRRRSIGPDTHGSKYGFAVWLPGLTIGLAFAAAAFAKLQREGLDWISTGAVRYHFVTDAASAPVEWGLWVAARPPLAVAMSAAAVIVEAAFIFVIVARRPIPRLMWGFVAAGFFAGLYFFQGVLWYPWLVLLVAFLPWQWLDRTSGHPRPVSPVTVSQRACVAVLVAAQIYASVRQIEREPFFSHFPMYSSTWASPQAFDADMATRYTRVLDARADGQEFGATFRALPVHHQMTLVRLTETGTVPAPELASVCRTFEERLGAAPQHLELTVEYGGFDWGGGKFNPPRRVPTKPTRLRSLCENAGRGAEDK